MVSTAVVQSAGSWHKPEALLFCTSVAEWAARPPQQGERGYPGRLWSCPSSSATGCPVPAWPRSWPPLPACYVCWPRQLWCHHPDTPPHRTRWWIRRCLLRTARDVSQDSPIWTPSHPEVNDAWKQIACESKGTSIVSSGENNPNGSEHEYYTLIGKHPHKQQTHVCVK